MFTGEKGIPGAGGGKGEGKQSSITMQILYRKKEGNSVTTQPKRSRKISSCWFLVPEKGGGNGGFENQLYQENAKKKWLGRSMSGKSRMDLGPGKY